MDIYLHSLVISNRVREDYDHSEIVSRKEIIKLLCGEYNRKDINFQAENFIFDLIKTKLQLGERVFYIDQNINSYFKTKLINLTTELKIPFIIDNNHKIHKKLFYIKDHILNNYKGITVIPDIHGDYDKLCAAIDWANKRHHFIIFLGDIIDYGKKSIECINLIYELLVKTKAVFILGNHEVKLLKLLHIIRSNIASIKINESNKLIVEKINNMSEKEYKILYAKIKHIATNSFNHINLDDFIFTHAACTENFATNNNRFLDDKDLMYALYGQSNESEVYELTYDWCDTIKNKTVVVGHDIRSNIHPVVYDNIENNTKVYFMDTGCSKGGKLTTVDLKYKDNKFIINNFNQF